MGVDAVTSVHNPRGNVSRRTAQLGLLALNRLQGGLPLPLKQRLGARLAAKADGPRLAEVVLTEVARLLERRLAFPTPGPLTGKWHESSLS